MSTTERLPRGTTRHEAPYLTKSVDELGELAQRLVEAGHSPETVRNLIGWLALKAAGVKDRSAQTTKAQYRKMLADLDGPRGRTRAAGTASTMMLLIMAIPMVAGASLIDRSRRTLCAEQVYITLMVGPDLLIVVVVVEVPVVSSAIVEAPSAEIHTLSAHRRPDVRSVCAYQKAA